MNNKRKNRQGPPRSPRGRVLPEGVYSNAHFMHAVTAHVGDNVQVLTQSGSLWEGVFKTFSAQFEVVLEVAHRVDAEGVVAVDSVVEKLIFKPQDVVSIRAKDSDLEYATHDVFQTDSAISSKFNGTVRVAEERQLEPWDACDGDAGESPALNGDASLDDLELDHRANGWDANDMFRKNEEVYGVHSTYDHSLAGYTLPLQRKDTQDYRDAEAKAEEIAAEIESAPAYKARIDAENGDEEERYAAVVRPGDPAPGKYVIPNKRKNIQSGKLVKPMGASNNGVSGGNSPGGGGGGTGGNKGREGGKEPRPPRHHLTPPADARPPHQQPPSPATGPNAAPNSSVAGAGKSYAAQAGSHHVPVVPHAPMAATGKLNGEPRAPPPHRHHHHNPPPPGEAMGRPPRHHAPPEPRRQDEVQELRKFGQEFKLVSSAAPPPAVAVATAPAVAVAPAPAVTPVLTHPPAVPAAAPSPPEVSANAPTPAPPAELKREPPVHKPPVNVPPPPKQEDQQPPPPQHQDRSPLSSPPTAASPVSVTLKKSTLNPNAKEFNPAAKPFTPRSPTTPNPSRPHTPGTPVGVGVGVGVGGVGLGGVGVVGAGVSYVPAPHPPPPHHMVAAVPAYAMVAAAAAAAQQPPTYLPHPHPLAYGAMGGGAGVAGVAGGAGQHAPMQAQQQRNFRKVGVGSGVQVAAATGQPLLAPAPMQQFVPYPHPHPGPHPAQPALQYQHMVRMYHGGGVVGGVVGAGGVGVGVGAESYPAAPSPAAASPALYPPPSPAHTPHPHPHPHPHQHPHPHHHHYQQPPFPVLCGLPTHHHHHHHVAYLNHAPPTASPPHHPHQLQQVLLPPQHNSSGGATTPGVHSGSHP
ncbi:hypothetical protein evm_007405 [Chilo suppressalis]|nr:hypothetical protein evm_007405 [Chilo suppressalis]